MLRGLAFTVSVLAMGLSLAIIGALAGPPAQAAAPAPAPDLGIEERAFVVLINDYRLANGLGPPAIDWEMQSAADWMSNDMGVEAYFSHTDSLGRTAFARMCAFDYDYNTWRGENLGAGYRAASDVLSGWRDSPGHNANMLGPNYVAMGIARVYVAGSPFGWYWTNQFGGVHSDASSASGGSSSTTLTEGR